MRPEEDIFDKKPQWNGSRSDYGNPESRKWQQYGQDYAQWRQALNREEYGKYGSAGNAGAAYSMGYTDMEAVRGAAVTKGMPSTIVGHATQVMGRKDGQDINDFTSDFTGHYADGTTRVSSGGNLSDGTNWRTTTYNFADGSSYVNGTDSRVGTGSFETYTKAPVDYGKKLGMNTVTAPKPIAPIK
jgi:hypothetical protein